MDTLGKVLFGFEALAAAINVVGIVGGKTVANRVISGISTVFCGLVLYYIYTH